MSETTGDEDYLGSERRKGAEVVDNLEGHRMRRGEGYAIGTGARNELVCCTQRRRGQVEFSSDKAPEYPSPRAGG